MMRFLPRFLRSDKDKGDATETETETSRSQTGDKKADCICNVRLLDDHEYTVTLKLSTKGYVLLDKVLDHLELLETDYFCLRYIDETKQTQWLDPNRSLYSQIKSIPPFRFYFGVKFYSADPCKLRDEITRYQVFLQVKNDMLQGRLSVTFEEASELAAFSVQSELGDYDPSQHTFGYTSEFQFIPNQTAEFEEAVATIHRRLVGIMPAVAEYKFLDKVKWLEMYGVDLHPVLGDGQLEYFLGLTPTGIVVYKNKVKVGNYFWPRILKVTHKGKIFIIKVKDRSNDEHSYAFETTSKISCKHLWKCCIEHHDFFRANQSGEPLKTGNSFFKWGSKARISFRREAQSPKPSRPYPTQVYRMRSRKANRRPSSESGLDPHSSMESVYTNNDEGALTVVATLEPADPYRHRSYPNLPRSPQSVRSVPWESNADGGLYTSGRESPESVRSEKMKFPARHRLTTSSDTELASRKKYFTRRGDSDNESDISVPRRRRKDEETSGSESESGYMRIRRQHYARSVNTQSSINGDTENCSAWSDRPGQPYESAKQRRKRRTRSRSPNSKRPPAELRQHFEYDLIDTEGMSTEQLQDIAFVNVQTKSEPFKLYYDKARRRYRSPHRHQMSGEKEEKGLTVDEVSVKSKTDATSTAENHVDPVTSRGAQKEPVYKSMGNTTAQANLNNLNSSRRDTPEERLSQSSIHSRSSRRPDNLHVDASRISQSNVSIRSSAYSASDGHPSPNVSQAICPSEPPTQPSREAYRQAMWKRYTSQSHGETPETSPSKKSIASNSASSIGASANSASNLRTSVTNSLQRHTPSKSQTMPSHLSSKSSASLQRYPTTSYTQRLPPHPPLAVQRPVYSWSHFQPVRQSPSPSQSVHSANLSGSFTTDPITRSRLTSSGQCERWTEL